MERASLFLTLLPALLAAAGGATAESPEREYSQFRRGGLMGLEEIHSGEVVVPPRYDFVEMPAGGLVRAGKDDRVAWFDLEGNMRIPFSAGWEWGTNFSEGLAGAARGGRWGFIDVHGKVVVPPRFRWVGEFHDGRAQMRLGDDLETTYVDRRGEPICDCWFRYTLDFKDGYAVVGEDSRQGILRRDGTLVLEPAFYRITNEGGGRLTVLQKEGEPLYPIYTEGVFVDGKGVSWNDNMSPVNAMVRRAKRFVQGYERLLDHWLDTGCPCQYPRFRELVLHSPERETLFNLSRDRFLDKSEPAGGAGVIDYTCRVCGTRYRATWYEYSAFAQGYKVELVDLQAETAGAAIVRPMPFLRFQTGYRMASEDRFREIEDVDEALDYLARLAGEEESEPLLERLRRWLGW